MFASSVATRSTRGPRPITAVLAAIAAGSPTGGLLVGLASVAYADTTLADPSSPATPTTVGADAVPTTSGLAASFDGGGSSDPDGTDATWVGNNGENTAGSGAASSHAHATAGIGFVSLTVTDKQGATITVTNPETVVARVTPSGTLLALSQSGTALQVVPVSETFINSIKMNARVQVFGAIPTTNRARTWSVCIVEPTDLQASVTGQTVTSRFDYFALSQL